MPKKSAAKKAAPKTDSHVIPRRSNGFLVCSKCKRSVAFQGINDPTTWPLHRCGFEVRPFERMVEDDPNHPPLTKYQPSPLETPDDRPEDMKSPVVDL